MLHGNGFHNRRSPASNRIGALSASTITRTTGATTYPPQVDFTRPIDWVDGIKAVMQWSTDYTFATGVSETSSPQTITAAVTSYNFGLSAIVSGSYFMRMGAWQGTRPGALNWSNILNVGDVTAPTISTGTTFSTNQFATGSITLTASEGISTWAVTAGAANFSVTPLTATTATLAWTAFSSGGTQPVTVSITDYAGNVGTWNGTLTVNAVTTSFNPADTAATLTLSAANMTATGNGTGPGFARTLNGYSSGKRAVQFSVGTAPGWYGIINGTDANNNYPASARFALAHDGSFFGGTTSVTANFGVPANGDVYVVAWDMTAAKAWLQKNGTWQGTGGDPNASGPGWDISACGATLFPFFLENGVGQSVTLQVASVPNFTSVV